MGNDVNPFSVFEEFALPAKASSHNPPNPKNRIEKASSILREGAPVEPPEDDRQARDEAAFERAFARLFLHRLENGQAVRPGDVWTEWCERCETQSPDDATRERRMDRDLESLMSTHAPKVHAALKAVEAAPQVRESAPPTVTAAESEPAQDSVALKNMMATVRESSALLESVDWRVTQHMKRHPNADKHETYQLCLREEALQHLPVNSGHPRHPAPSGLTDAIKASAKAQTDEWKARVLKETGEKAWIGADGVRRSEKPGAGKEKKMKCDLRSAVESKWLSEAFTIPSPGKKTEYKRYTPFPGEVELGREYAEQDRGR